MSVTLVSLQERYEEARLKLHQHERILTLALKGLDATNVTGNLDVLQGLFNTRNELKSSLQNIDDRMTEVQEEEERAQDKDGEACSGKSVNTKHIIEVCRYEKGHLGPCEFIPRSET